MSPVAVFRSASTTLQKLAAACAVLMTMAATSAPPASPSSPVGHTDGTAFIEDWVWAVVAVSLVIAALYVWKGYSSSGSTSRLRRFVTVVTAVAFLLAVVRAFVVPSGAMGPWVPNLDIVTLAWFAIAIGGALAQLILDAREDPAIIELSGLNEALREEKQELVATSASLFTESANLMQNWAAALNSYVAAATEHDPNVDWSEGAPIVRPRYPNLMPRWHNFMVLRLMEAWKWLDPTDEPRLSVWLVKYPATFLSFGGCTQKVSESLRAARFGANEGIAGAAFAERAVYDVIDPVRHPLFKHFEDVPYPYKSMLVVPICYGPLTLGVLCVDRICEENFAPMDVKVMKSLADHLGIALGLAEACRIANGSTTGGD